MTPLTGKLARWLSANVSCVEFARHVAMGIEPPRNGLRGRLHFWCHWVWCPYCRQYWDEIRVLGAAARSQYVLRHHPAVKLAEVKARMKAKLMERYT